MLVGYVRVYLRHGQLGGGGGGGGGFQIMVSKINLVNKAQILSQTRFYIYLKSQNSKLSHCA